MKRVERSSDLLSKQIVGKEIAGVQVPSAVAFQVTDRCNYECSHCYQEHTGEDELSTEEVMNVLEQLSQAGVLFLTLVGGEFFMRRDADEIITEAHRLGFAIKLLTTGHHIHDKRADLLATCRPLQVDISIYGAKPAAHEHITNQAGSWTRSLEAVRRLVARKIPVVLKTPVMQSSLPELEEIQALANELGADFSFDPKITAIENGDLEPTMMRMNHAEMGHFFGNVVGDFLTETYGGAGEEELRPLHAAPCRAGRDICFVNARGEVWPCNNLPVPVGSLREQSFASIWTSSESLQDVRDLHWATIAECNQCPVRDYCGRCSGMALVEHGDMKGPSLEACRQAVAIRDSLRERGVLPDTHRALPPTWDRVDKDGLHHRRNARGVRSSALRVL